MKELEQLVQDLEEEAEAHLFTSRKYEIKADQCAEIARQIRRKIQEAKT
jgi:hypothetical protein